MMPGNLGTLYGIGVGPGPAGFVPVAALEALRHADLIYAPRARGAADSVALQCLASAGFVAHPDKLREIEFNMDPDRSVLSEHYAQLADTLAVELLAGRNVAYLTLAIRSRIRPTAMSWPACASGFRTCRSAPSRALPATQRPRPRWRGRWAKERSGC